MVEAALRIAHISDLHVLDLEGTHWTRFLNKRVTGAVNLAGLRRNAHPVYLAEKLADRLAERDIDHVILTGDVTNLALDSEFRRARQVVERIGPPRRVTIVPGNHDLYTRGALRHNRFEKWFAEYLVDEGEDHEAAHKAGRLHYPFVRKPAPHVRIYGLSSAIPTPPLLAFGHVGKHQLERLRALRREEPRDVNVRIALVHHNLHHRIGPAEYLATLIDRKAFGRTMHDIGATIVLHGHTHSPHQGHLPRATATKGTTKAEAVERIADRLEDRLDDLTARELGGDIPVIGCGSSTWSRRGVGDFARFNVLDIDAKGLRTVRSYRFDTASGQFRDEHADLLEKAMGNTRAIRL
jgi:3',5'-cyclic AMP phosphodiesterase CpdA